MNKTTNLLQYLLILTSPIVTKDLKGTRDTFWKVILHHVLRRRRFGRFSDGI